MKKSLFYALAATAIFSSCSQDNVPGINDHETEDLVPIKIGVAYQSQTLTRGTGTVGGVVDEHGNVPEGEALSQWAGQELKICMFKQNSEGTLEFSKFNDSDIFNNFSFNAPKEGETGFATTPDGSIAYYPSQGIHSFWGYHIDDAAVSEPYFNNDRTELILDFKIDGSQDIMVAKAEPSEADKEALGDMAYRAFSSYSARISRADGTSIQPELKFKHLLTRFTFCVQGGDVNTCDPETGIAVDSIIVYSKSQGQLVVAYTGEDREQISFAEELDSLVLMERENSDELNKPLVPMNSVIPQIVNGTPALTPVGDALIVAPAEKYNIRIVLHQNVNRNENSGELLETRYTYTDELPVRAGGYLSGHSYKVNIKLWGLQRIELTTTLEPWISDEQDPIELAPEETSFQ